MNEITLDINKSGQIINEPVVLRVGEKDQTITVKLLKDGQAYTNFSTATFNANKQNGSIIANDPADISNGVITYSVPQKLVNEFGKITNAYFLIDGKTTTESFVIAVLKGVNLSSDDLNDYIPGMGELQAIYDEWKDKLKQIEAELDGMDAPKEISNVVENELEKYSEQLSELQDKIDKTGGDITQLNTDIANMQLPEGKVDVTATSNWQKQALFNAGDYKLVSCPSGSDFETFLKSDTVPKGLSIVRDNNFNINWIVLKELSNWMWGVSSKSSVTGINYFQIENNQYSGNLSTKTDVPSALIGKTLTLKATDGTTTTYTITGLS